MPLGDVMRKLQFIADCEKHSDSQVDACQATQGYVKNLLTKELVTYGFNISPEQNQQQLAVQVEDHPIGLGVNCDVKNENGLLVCEISAHADEEQDWFAKIETQSVIKQLAQAVENTLKDDQSFSEFHWK